MKIINLICLIILLSQINTISILSQDGLRQKEYSEIIPNHTELRKIHSKIIDEEYFLYVKLPRDYKESKKSYPVIYLLDGDISFTMAWSTVRYLQYGKNLSDVIIVGIGYGSLLSSSEQNMRERDYTISEVERWKGSGGGIKFVEFLETELIPFVDSKYRTEPDQRVLNGYSLGGLISLYTYVNKNDLFSGYIAGSPYILSDLDYLSKIIEDNSNLLEKSSKKIFISFGQLEGDEKYTAPIENIVELLDSKNIDGVKLTVFENGTHFTCPSEAMVYGLKFIFE